jgi:hypothetical protein
MYQTIQVSLLAGQFPSLEPSRKPELSTMACRNDFQTAWARRSVSGLRAGLVMVSEE